MERPPLRNNFERKNTKALAYYFKGNQKSRINLNGKIIKFGDFASLVSKITFRAKLVKISKFFFWSDVKKIGINQTINYQKYRKLIKLILISFSFNIRRARLLNGSPSLSPSYVSKKLWIRLVYSLKAIDQACDVTL